MSRAMSVAALLVIGACGSRVDATGTDASTTTSTTTGGSESGIPCDDYASAPMIGPAVTVSMRHDGTTPVYFFPRGCGAALPIEVTAAATDEPVPHTLGECFPVLCDDFLGQADCSQGCNDCAVPGAGRIEPGATGQGGWSGAWLVPLEMTESCAPGTACQTTCQRQDQAPAGTYELALTIYRGCTGTCDCDEPTPDGVCSLWGGAQLVYAQTYVATIDYPNELTAELVLDD